MHDQVIIGTDPHKASNTIAVLTFVIRDGAGQYTRTFDHVFAAIGADAIKTPPDAPQAKNVR